VDPTADAAAVKPALVAPAGTVTVAGTVTAALLLDRPTLSPPVGAAVFNFTVHALFANPDTDALLHESELTAADAVVAPQNANRAMQINKIVKTLPRFVRPSALPGTHFDTGPVMWALLVIKFGPEWPETRAFCNAFIFEGLCTLVTARAFCSRFAEVCTLSFFRG